jgi:hypothetical protein
MSHVTISRRAAASLVGGHEHLVELVKRQGPGYSGELLALADGTRLIVRNLGKRLVFGVYAYHGYGDIGLDLLPGSSECS